MINLIESGDIILTNPKYQRDFSIDIVYPETTAQLPCIIFLHGFKGFKDWGHFPMAMKKLASKGFVVLKMNFSHNGTIPNQPRDFVDLEAFGNNNFLIELEDIQIVLQQIKSFEFVDYDKIAILGHSKGGATAIIAGAELEAIKVVITWAGVTNIIDRYAGHEIDKWRNDGVKYIFNGRTNQEMPLFFQLASSILDNRDLHDIKNHISQLDKPLFQIHGTNDSSVSIEETSVCEHIPNSNVEQHYISGADHSFGGKHPWHNPTLPDHTNEACNKTADFLNKIF